MADIYTNYINQVYITLFFSPVAPLGTFITAVGFAVQYVIDKKVLTKQSSLKK